MCPHDTPEPRHRHCREPRAAMEELRELRESVDDPDVRARIDERIADLRRRCDDGGSQPPPPPPPPLKIDGIEYTQATQFFRSELDPCPDRPGRSGPCPDNDIPLVGLKTTVLRVYPDVLATSGIQSVSGWLRIKGEGDDQWSDPITPINGAIDPRYSRNIDRGEADHTLNFRIPARHCRGRLATWVRISDAGQPDGATTSRIGTVQFTRHSYLDLRAVRIRYENDDRTDGPEPDGSWDVDAPTLWDFYQTAWFTHRTFPISGIRVKRSSVELYDGDFTSFFESGGPDARGTTGTIYEILNDLLATEDFDEDVIYVAVIPGGPNQTGSTGHATYRKCITEVDEGPTMAQEIGHNCSAIVNDHAPCGNPPNPDNDYPDYGDASYPAASIGEYGFNVVRGEVLDPTSTHDFMSYCGPNWVSPYIYEKLMGCFGPASVTGTAPPEVRREPRERFYLPVTIDRSGRIAATGAGVQLPGRPIGRRGDRSPYVAELRAPSGRILESQRLRQTDFHRTADDDHQEFLVDLPWHNDTGEIVFMRDDEVLDSFEIAPEPPAVELESADLDEELLSEDRTISWSYPDGDGPATSRTESEPTDAESVQHVRYSNDGGTTWSTIGRDVRGTELRVDPAGLPGGDDCRFQVVASEGFRTGVATSEPVRVSQKPREPFIVFPEEGDRFADGELVQFLGLSRSPTGASQEGTLQWSSSVDGYLGSGGVLVEHALSVGTHRITLDTDASLENGASASVTIRVVGDQ